MLTGLLLTYASMIGLLGNIALLRLLDTIKSWRCPTAPKH